MSVYLENAKRLLSQIKNPNPAIHQATDELNNISKSASISDLLHDPKFQNIINLLTPFLVNYKVNQVVKLLNELQRENKWWR